MTADTPSPFGIPVDNSLTVNLHADGQWSVKAHFGGEQEPGMSVGGKLTDFEVIELFRHWVLDGTPDPDEVIDILRKARQGAAGTAPSTATTVKS